MIGIVTAATVTLGLAAGAALILPDRSREARRLVLLVGIVTTLLLPLGVKLARLMKIQPLAVLTDLGGVGSAGDGSADHPVLTLIWLTGACLMFSRLIWHGLLVFRWRAASRSLRDDEVAFVAETLSLTQPDIARSFRVADSNDTPMVLAGRSQTVLLPSAWQSWPDDLKRSALRHEWQHVLSADAQWAVVGALLRACLWFHPLAWWVCARWAEQCEHLADHAATLGRPAADYAQELLALAEESRPGSLAFATAFIPPTLSRLERRVRAVLDVSTRCLPCGRVLRVLVLAAFAAVGLSLAAALAPKMKTNTADLKVEAKTRLLANPFPGDP